MRQTTFLLFAVSLTACVGAAARSPNQQPPAPGDVATQFEVAGHRLYLECAGVGSPAIILQNGQGVDHRSWNAVWPALSRMSRVCRYDRAGTGTSTTGPYPTSGVQITDELHSLLARAHVPPPYIMVGHSFGGLAARMYAMRFRNDVAALMLIESSSEFYDRSFDSSHVAFAEAGFADPVERRQFDDLADELRYFGRHPATGPEGIDWELTYRQMSALDAASLSSIPLAVLSARDRSWTSPPIFATRVRDRVANLWLSAQDSLAALSSRSTHVVAEHAGHFVQQDRPDVVEEALRTLLNSSRGPGKER